jgi:hypothetical protein
MENKDFLLDLSIKVKHFPEKLGSFCIELVVTEYSFSSYLNSFHIY